MDKIQFELDIEEKYADKTDAELAEVMVGILGKMMLAQMAKETPQGMIEVGKLMIESAVIERMINERKKL